MQRVVGIILFLFLSLFAQGGLCHAQVVRDTVYVSADYNNGTLSGTLNLSLENHHGRKGKNGQLESERKDKKPLLIALRTNALAVPLANIGAEFSVSSRFSVGADLYYPWIWRRRQGDCVDYKGWCFQMMALDLEGRYWLGGDKKEKLPLERRLLGHSVGVYAAAGYYDFQRNYSGHQGEFVDVGVDYLYACPVFGGRLHLEFEIGVGYIYSASRPYDCFEPGGKCFAQKGVRKYFRWWGPTRAQVSVVVPIRIGGKKKEVHDE